MAIDWSKVKSSLPYRQTPEDKAKREELWKLFDVNGNGLLSLAEVDKGIRDALNDANLFDCKPVIIRAFTTAKDSHKSKSKSGDDYVERVEFRTLILYLAQYFKYYKLFLSADQGGDRRIDFAEFTAALPKIEKHAGKIADPQATFNEIDKNGGGQILFGEFCDWAIAKKISLEGDDE